MKILAQRIVTNPNYLRALEWGKLVTITGSAQILIQAVGLISGILVIRLLSTREYALFTLANTMLGTMSVLADGGISAGVMAQGGKYWQSPTKLGEVLVTGFDLRKRFAVVSLLFAIPVLIYLLRHHQASWLMAVLIVLCLLPAFIMGLSGTLLEIAPKLHQDIILLQKNQIVTNLARLSLSLSLFLFPWAFMAVLAAGIPQIWANKNLRRISEGYADWKQESSPFIRREIITFVKRILPGSIYYCLSGQITIWLISLFGSTIALAQIGALGRLAMMLSLFSVLINTLIVPRFARLSSQANVLLRRYLQIQIGLFLLSAIIITGVWLFPIQVLWLLGQEYSNLKTELILSIINACLGLIGGVSFSLCTCRGWVINPIISIPITIFSLILGIYLLDISTLRGVLVLNIFVSVIELSAYLIHNIFKITKSEPLYS